MLRNTQMYATTMTADSSTITTVQMSQSERSGSPSAPETSVLIAIARNSRLTQMKTQPLARFDIVATQLQSHSPR